MGHKDPAVTLRRYAHLFERARHADDMRDKLSEGFGHLLAEQS
jgi:hypothetical protein